MANKKGGEVLTRPLIKLRLTRADYVRGSLLSVAPYPIRYRKVRHFFRNMQVLCMKYRKIDQRYRQLDQSYIKVTVGVTSA